MGKVKEIRREFLCNCKILYWKCCEHFKQFVIGLFCNTSRDSFHVKTSLIYTLFLVRQEGKGVLSQSLAWGGGGGEGKRKKENEGCVAQKQNRENCLNPELFLLLQ